MIICMPVRLNCSVNNISKSIYNLVPSDLFSLFHILLVNVLLSYIFYSFFLSSSIFSSSFFSFYSITTTVRVWNRFQEQGTGKEPV